MRIGALHGIHRSNGLQWQSHKQENAEKKFWQVTREPAFHERILVGKRGTVKRPLYWTVRSQASCVLR